MLKVNDTVNVFTSNGSKCDKIGEVVDIVQDDNGNTLAYARLLHNNYLFMFDIEKDKYLVINTPVDYKKQYDELINKLYSVKDLLNSGQIDPANNMLYEIIEESNLVSSVGKGNYELDWNEIKSDNRRVM